MATLLGEWGFLDNLNDTSGNGHTATATGYTPSYVTGPTTGTKAIRLTGATQTVSYGRAGLEPAAGTGGVTSMAWVKIDVTAPSLSTYYGVIHHSRDGGGSTRAGIQLYQNRFRPMARWRDQTAFADGIGINLATTGGWHHLCVVDGEDRYEWYVDGVSVGTAARTNHTTAVTWESYNWLTGHQALADANSYDGYSVTGVRIFAGQLTTTEVNTWMNTPITGSVSPTTGSASASVTVAGSATGSRTPVGTASGSATVDGASTGLREPVASSSGAVTVSGSATGTRDALGTGSGSLLFAGDASGLSPVEGTGSASVTVAGSASGTGVRGGSATGDVILVGSGTGSAVLGGHATGAVLVHGTAVGRSAQSRDITIIAATEPRTRTVASHPASRLDATRPGSRWAGTAPER